MNPNSALIWLSKIEAAGLPVPRTVVIPYDHHACMSIFDGDDSEEFERLLTLVEQARDSFGGRAFIRTDLGSAKHAGISAWLAGGDHVLFRLLEDQECKYWLEPHGPSALLVREFLTLPAPFTAFHGLPISREWRFFASPTGVLCQHPYWPQHALDGHLDAAPANWRELLTEMHRLPRRIRELRAMAVCAATACDGEWSVDFAQDATGKWYLIDMAMAKDSWHWPTCANAPREVPCL